METAPDKPVDKSVLIIEDEIDFCELISDAFISDRWQVSISTQLGEIKEIIPQVSLVLMDWHVPGIDSQELYRLCAQKPTQVISGDLSCPVPGALIKPFRIEKLLQRCRAKVRPAEGFMVGDKVISKVSLAFGKGIVTQIQGDDCWVEFKDGPTTIRYRAIRCNRAHLVPCDDGEHEV